MKNGDFRMVFSRIKLNAIFLRIKTDKVALNAPITPLCYCKYSEINVKSEYTKNSCIKFY